MADLRRISAGTGANMLNLGYVAAVTAIGVPVLTRAWGVEGYGIWVMLTALPTYLAMSDFGFSTAATNDIAMKMAVAEREQANETLHSVWLLNLVAAGAMLLLAAVGGLALLATRFAEYAATGAVLVAYTAAALLSRVPLGGFRGTGFYTRGTLIYDAIQFVEGLACVAAAAFGGGFLAAALALLAGRLVNLAVLCADFRRTVSVLPLGIRHATRATLKRLLAPALASLTIPVALALNMQGVALVVGALISPTATAVLATSRTVSRIAVQAISAINRALVPELSAAHARGDHAAAAKIHRINALVLAGIVLPAAVGFVWFGAPAIALWTGDRIDPPVEVLAGLGVAMLFHCIWFFGTNLLSATNRHGAMAGGLLTAAIGTVALAALVAPGFGLAGAAAAVALGEAASVAWFWWVRKTSAVVK